jgi:hypothetical protein
MKKYHNIMTRVVVATAVFISACASIPAASEHKGDWKKINTFEPRVDTIPLEKEYFFTTLKVDATLMGLLQRWANDVELGLEIRCRNDYSVSEKLFDVQTRSLAAAIEEINYIYAKQELDVSLNKETSFIVFSCGKNNKESFLGDRQIKLIEPIRQLPFEGQKVDLKKVASDQVGGDVSGNIIRGYALKLNVSEEMKSRNSAR